MVDDSNDTQAKIDEEDRELRQKERIRSEGDGPDEPVGDVSAQGGGQTGGIDQSADSPGDVSAQGAGSVGTVGAAGNANEYGAQGDSADDDVNDTGDGESY